MVATHSKPTKIPRWATTSLNITEPSEGQKDVGWGFQQIPPSAFENWRANTVEKWINWIDERLFDGASADELIIKDPSDGSDAIKITNTEIVINKGVSFNGSYGFSSHFFPLTDNTYDIGEDPRQIRNIYVGNVAAINELVVTTDVHGGSGQATIDNLILSTTAGEGLKSHLIPALNNTYDVGSLTYKIKDMHIAGNINIATDANIDGTGNIDTLVLGTSASEGIGSHFYPTADKTYDCGKSSLRFNVGYFDAVTADSVIVIETPQTAVHPDSIHAAGTIAWDSNYLYVKTATVDGWKRIALTAIP